MSWYNKSIEELLKDYNIKKTSYVFTENKSKNNKKSKHKFEIEYKTQKTAPKELKDLTKDFKVLKEWRKDAKKNFYELASYSDALNPSTMINPCPMTLNGLNENLEIDAYRVTYIPAMDTSYLKLWDIIQNTDIVPDKVKMVTGQIGDNPGGFSQALIFYRRHKYKNNFEKNIIFGMNANQPSELKTEKFVQLYNKEQGKTKIFEIGSPGGVLDHSSLLNYISLFDNLKADFVTANGGADLDPKNLDQRDLLFSHILFSEVVLSLCIQKEEGNMVAKILNIDYQITADILCLLYCLYDKIEIVKPVTTRLHSSERYVLCYGFKGIDKKDKEKLLDIHKNWKDYPKKLLKDVPKDFIKQIVKSKKIINDFQEPVLKETLKIKKKDIPLLKKAYCKNILYAIDWCLENSVRLKNEYFNIRNKKMNFRDGHLCFPEDLNPLK